MDSDPELPIPGPLKTSTRQWQLSGWLLSNVPKLTCSEWPPKQLRGAHLYGIPDLITAVPVLEQILLAESTHPAARFAAARALIVLESRGSEQKLFEASQSAWSGFRQLVEPAIARWDSSLAKPVWIKRLDDPQTRSRDLLLAMRGLALVREPSAVPRLLSIARDPLQGPVIRLEAAWSTGQIAETGLEGDAEQLVRNTSSPQFVNQLIAIRFLARHTTDNARQVLVELAEHDEPAIAAAALNRLNEIDSTLVVPLAEAAMKNSDQRVRWEGATAYLRLPTTDRIAPLAQLLSDTHPGVRRDVCEGLVGLSVQPELLESILEATMQILNGNRWEGQEQSALLLASLRYQPAANRLTELLESTAWKCLAHWLGQLRKVAVAETIPALINKASRLTEEFRSGTLREGDDQLVHLMEALGVLKAGEAVPLFRQYIPKSPILSDRTRSAAIWALGFIHEGKRDAELEAAFCDRINDFSDVKPEADIIKQMCAIALVRMKAVERAPDIRAIVESYRVASRPSVILRWAVEELTGEILPPPERSLVNQGNWFLQPFP